MSNLYRGPSIDASYQVSVHLAKWFERRIILKNRPIRNKNCLWRPYLLMDQHKMSNLYRGPSIDASYQVSVHLAKGFQRRRLKCEKITDDGRQVMGKKLYKMPDTYLLVCMICCDQNEWNSCQCGICKTCKCCHYIYYIYVPPHHHGEHSYCK